MAIFEDVFVGARVYNNANINLGTSGVSEALTFNSERWDTSGIHSTSVNTSRLTCPAAGKYLVYANIEFNAHATGYRQVYFLFGGADIWAIANVPSCGAVDATRVCLSSVMDLAAGDYVECWATQTSGGALLVKYNAKFSPEFGMQRIG